jgi:DNA-binding transcriptional MerR regulator
MSQSHTRSISRLTITQAARIFRMTPRALRFYDEAGLIETYRDGLNRRVFDPSASRRLEWIGLLRAANIPLADIRQVLATDAESEVRARACAVLQRRRAEVTQDLVTLDEAIERLDANNPWSAPLPRRRTAFR